jgi:predicted O-methyltransferase YrrM
MNDPKTFAEPLAGYLLDLWSRIRNRPFTPHSLTKLHNLRTARILSGAKTVIEIGTYKGVTTKRLSRLFDKVVTVEIDAKLFEEAKRRCARCNNITFHLGDGSKLLPEILGRENDMLVFLDGHFSGAGTGQGDEPEPALAELDLIAAHLERVRAIVIDDFRLFGVEPGWPRKSEVLAKLESVFPQKIWDIVVLNDELAVFRRPARILK